MIPLFGTSIRATGEGATLSEAKAFAGQELLTKIIVTVSSEQRLIQAASDKDKTELFFEDIQLQSELDLIGVEYQTVELNKNRVVVTAVLSDSTLPLYMDKLSLLKQSIEEIEKRLDEQSSIESKKVYLLRLISYYAEYEAYSIIARLFDNTIKIPRLSRTRAGAELDYLNLLIAESELLNITLADIKQGTSSIKSQLTAVEAKSKIQMIAQQLEINQRELNRIEQEQSKKRDLFFSDIQNAIQESAKQMVLLADIKNGQRIDEKPGITPYELIVQLEDLKQRYLEIQAAIMNEYNYLSEGIKNRYEQEIATIEGASYRIGEIANGMPTEWAINLRNNQIVNKNGEMQIELDLVMKALENSVASQMFEIKTSIELGYKNLESKTFFIDSSSSDFVYKIESYDGLIRAWPIMMNYTILGVDFQQDLELTYSEVTSLPLPNFSTETDDDIEAYYQYLNNVELYETYLMSTTGPITTRVSYSISISDQLSSYVIIPRAYTVIRTDTGRIILEQPIEDAVLDSKVYIYQPTSNFQFPFESVYDLELSRVAEKKKEIERKEKIKNHLASELSNPKMFYRSGIGISIGTGFFDYTYTYTYSNLPNYSYDTEISVIAFPISLSVYFTPINYFYLGLSLDAQILLDYMETYPSYIGVSSILGLTYPLYSESISSVWKPFLELRLGTSAMGTETVLGLGVAYCEKDIGIGGDMAIRINTSGPLKGMFSMISGVTF